MLDKVREFIKKENLIKKGDSIVIGLSGGADSVSLFIILATLREEYDLTLYAVHINHGIRGDKADADEAFSKRLAEKYGVECRCVNYPVKELAVEWKMTEEEAGRTVRYKVFEEMRKEKNAKYIAVAHHRDDQAETVLFRMCRGTGIRGLRGMLPKRDAVIRPLLSVSRAEIEAYLKDMSQEYCIDHTNEMLDYNRNRIRNKVMPELEKVNAGVTEHIYEMTVQIRDIYEWFEEECKKYFFELVEFEEDGVKIKLKDLTALKDAVATELIRQMIGTITESLKDIENRHVAGIYELAEMETGKSIKLPYNLTACREYDYIRIFKNIKKSNKNTYSHIINIDSGCDSQKISYEFADIYLPEERELKSRIIITKKYSEYDGNMEKVPKNICTKWFDYDKIKGNISLRRPRPDDYIFIGGEARKKLTRYMIDNKIPRQYRDRLLVLAKDSEVLWIIGGRMNPCYYVRSPGARIMELSLKY